MDAALLKSIIYVLVPPAGIQDLPVRIAAYLPVSKVVRPDLAMGCVGLHFVAAVV